MREEDARTRDVFYMYRKSDKIFVPFIDVRTLYAFNHLYNKLFCTRRSFPCKDVIECSDTRSTSIYFM